MNFTAFLQCPDCQGHLEADLPGALLCTACSRTFPMRDGAADFLGEEALTATDPHRYGIHPDTGEIGQGDLLARIKAAAGGRWPNYLGDVLELGCGIGQMTGALLAGEAMRGLAALDSSLINIQACRARLPEETVSAPAVLFAALGQHQNAIRDAVVDTVFGVDLLSRCLELKPLLRMVHRALRPGGRAWFIVTNRRFRQAACQAIAEGLAQRYARDRSWPEGHAAAAGMLGNTRLLMLHQDDPDVLGTREEKRLFDSEALEDLGLEAGFATAEMIPLEPDPVGAETVLRLCTMAGVPDSFAKDLAPLAASCGRPVFGLLSRRDASDKMLFWLTKAPGPQVTVFSGRPVPESPGFTTPDTAVGGAPPRWSIELEAHDTPAGVMVTVGGWCLSNMDIRWLRITLAEATRDTPVWYPRPDVHQILNANGRYHPLNALSSGLTDVVLFDDVHPVDGRCPLRLEVILANGLTLKGPVPESLTMNELMVISQ